MQRSRTVSLVLALAVVCTALLAAPAPAQSVGDAGLDIAFLVDGSGSISAADWEIQKAGIANALEDRRSFPVDGSVAVSVVQWASSSRVEIPYTVLDSAETLDAVVAAVSGMAQMGGGTSPHLGLDAGTALLEGSQDPEHEQVFCMSTDGSPSSQSMLESSASDADSAGVERYTVLAIEDPPYFFADDAQRHYGPAVFGGGTVVTTRNAAEFASLVTGACLGEPVELVGLEVNQVVQDWTNSVPLVTGKSTIVRAHVQAIDSASVLAVGRLHGERNGVELPGSPLHPLNAGGSIEAGPDALAVRGDLDASLNFALPPGWRSGQVNLRLELVGGGVVCAEAAAPANTCSTTVAFESVATPVLRMVEVIYEDAAGVEKTVSIAERNEQAERIATALPVASVDHTNAELSRRFVEPDTEGGREDFLGDVNESLLTARSNDGRQDLYLGVLKDSIPDGGGGLAAGIQANAASWFMSGTEDREAYGYARNRGAHEVGHAIGERHAADADGNTHCSDKSAGGGAVEYPFVETIGGDERPTLGPLGDPDTEVWGVDPRFVVDGSNADLAITDPNVTFALMGYCNSLDNTSQGRWTDSFYLPRFMDDVNAIDWSEGPVPDDGGVWGFFRGLWPFDEAAADVEFKPFFANAPGVVPTAMPAGDYVLELQDAVGAVVETVAFEPTVFEGDAAEDGSEATSFGMFVIPVAGPPDFTTAVVRDPAGVVIGTISASTTAPTVEITAPTAGDTFTGDTVTATWNASDPDGDTLTYVVQYSHDDGATWTTVAVDHPDTSIERDREELAGSDGARIRVIASDGVRSTMADSGRFSVANNAPVVAIHAPGDGQLFTGVQSVFFQASVTDTEDGRLEGASIVWTSDLDGFLGTGTELVRSASELREGSHTVTATGTDSAGVVTAQSVTIEIARVAPPPVVDDPRILLDQLIDSVDGSEVDEGLRRSLLAKLVNARDKLNDDKVGPACGMLGAFGNELDAQDGKGVPAGVAADWRRRLARIQELLGCP